MEIHIVSEYNSHGALMQMADYPGAYTRGATEGAALGKATGDLEEYALWAGMSLPPGERA